jgi:hypothetical protein
MMPEEGLEPPTRGLCPAGGKALNVHEVQEVDGSIQIRA